MRVVSARTAFTDHIAAVRAVIATFASRRIDDT